MKTTSKVWLGVGAFVVIGTGATGGGLLAAATAPGVNAPRAPTTQTAIPRMDAGRIVVAEHAGMDHPAKDKEAGEGGETKDLANLPPELAFAVRIVLLQGHLSVGNELVTQQQWNAALPHFLHPTEEIYGDIKDHLGDYDVPPFDGALKALADVVKAKKGGSDYDKALKAVLDAVAAAYAGMKAKQQANWPGFMVETAVEALKAAANEYQLAIVGGRIAKPVEYQDARGFIWQADRTIGSVAAQLQEKDPAALREVRAGIAQLEKAFPSAMPPRIPVKDGAAVLGDVARIELAAGKLM
jgi:hypothetical protein